VITLKFFGDESADETKSRVFAVAIVAGTEDEWTRPEREWLRRNRGLEFHANKCESEYARHPDRQKHVDNLKRYRDLTTILAESHLVGLSVALDLKSQRECLPGVHRDTGYYKCFSDVIANCARMANAFNNDHDQHDEVRLEFAFDSRTESDGTARTIYAMFRDSPEWADSSIFDVNVSFEAEPNPRLEMADLLAREAMKELDRKITHVRPEPGKSYQALDGSGKFIWIEHDRAYCERWRDKVKSPESEADLQDYKKWLVDTKRVQNGRLADNPTNRVLFYAWLEKRDASTKRDESFGSN
jgi:hypothetical protein